MFNFYKFNDNSIILVIVVIINISTLRGYYGQETCITTSGTTGNCISITQCNPLLNVLRQAEILPASETGNLKRSLCGVEGTTPKVCCPTTTTSNTQVGSLLSGGSGSELTAPDISGHRNLGLINNGICGPITETRIINGNKTGVLEFPWMALIKYDINNQYQQFQCGGTVINKRYILTAAHCVTGLKPGRQLYGVRLGEHDLNKGIDCDEAKGKKLVCADKYQDFGIETYHAHERYRTTSQDDDIALIKIDRDADFASNNVKPICLPVGDTVKYDLRKVLVTGWGRTETNVASSELLKVRLVIPDKSDCERIWQQSNGIKITPRQICAGGISTMDSCAGDSGGPLMKTDSINGVPKFIQYGIVSFGTKDCGIIGYPGVYTNIIYYMDWILDRIN